MSNKNKDNVLDRNKFLENEAVLQVGKINVLESEVRVLAADRVRLENELKEFKTGLPDVREAMETLTAERNEANKVANEWKEYAEAQQKETEELKLKLQESEKAIKRFTE